MREQEMETREWRKWSFTGLILRLKKIEYADKTSHENRLYDWNLINIKSEFDRVPILNDKSVIKH
jgi:hypothetical protein